MLKYLRVFHIKESPWKTLLVRNLVYLNTFSNYALAASPVFEHNGGNVPIQFFGKPFTIVSNETRHCLHGPTKVRIPFENRVFNLMKCTSSIRFLHFAKLFNFSRYFSRGIHRAFRILRKHNREGHLHPFTSELLINVGCVQFLKFPFVISRIIWSFSVDKFFVLCK